LGKGETGEITSMKAIITQSEFATLPEPVQAEYTKRDDGTFLANVEAVNGFALENVEGLKNTVAQTRRERDEAIAAAKKFADLDPDKARQAIAKLEELKDATPQDKVKEQIDLAVREIKAKAESDLKAASEQSQSYLTQLREKLVDDEVRTALSGMELIDGGVELLMPHIRNQVEVKEVGGRQVVRVKGDNGTERVSMKSGSTDPMDLKEFITLLPQNTTFKGVFKGKGTSGSGGKPEQQRPNGGMPNGADPSKPDLKSGSFDAAERLAAARRGG
jgi:DNA-directed RNA polymerase subunit F